MSGVRLHHATYRAAEGATLTYVVELPQKYHRGYYDCPSCGKQHSHKAIHLRLDGQGDTIVSQQVYKQLATKTDGQLSVLDLAGLQVMNEVKEPPPLIIGAVAKDKERIVEAPLNPQAKAEDKITPGRTKYESRDRMEEVLKPVKEAKLEAKDRAETKKRAEKRRIFTPKGAVNG